jgi:hypothetical protein
MKATSDMQRREFVQTKLPTIDRILWMFDFK